MLIKLSALETLSGITERASICLKSIVVLLWRTNRTADNVELVTPSYFKFSNCFSSETVGLIENNFHMECPGNRGTKVCSNEAGHMPNMRTMSMYAKKNKIENTFMKHYALNHMLAPKEGASQKGV